MFTQKEIEDLATKMALEVYPKEPGEDLGQMQFLRDTFIRNATECIKKLQSDFAIISKEFVKRQRLTIEYDKKTMMEKPDGARMALAGVYQSNIELIDKIFGKDFLSTSDNG